MVLSQFLVCVGYQVQWIIPTQHILLIILTHPTHVVLVQDIQVHITQEVQLNSIFVKVNYEIMKINLKDVDLIEALDDYIKIYTKPSPVLTLMTLKGILEKLPPRDFIRVHRSYIVPISKIDRFSKSKIWVGEKEIPIGSSYGSVYDQLLAHSQAK